MVVELEDVAVPRQQAVELVLDVAELGVDGRGQPVAYGVEAQKRVAGSEGKALAFNRAPLASP